MKALSLMIAYCFIGSILLFSFQNCAQEGFKVIEGVAGGVEAASTTQAANANLLSRLELDQEINTILQQSSQSAPILFNGVSAVSLRTKAAGLAPSADLTIAAGEVVVIDASINVRSLTINGSLACDNNLTQNAVLQAEVIYVNGTFECGSSQSNRFYSNLTIKLKDNGSTTSSRRGFIVNRGGKLKLFGNLQNAGWQKLAASATAGSRTLVLQSSVAGKWAIGDSIVVGATSYDLQETELMNISQISSDGMSVTLDRPLRFAHWGTIQEFAGKSGAVQLDQRAEVANLSRNIKVMPDESNGVISQQDGVGGHMMVAPGGSAYIDSIELYHMGQAGIMGRYPFHWHKAGDVYGQFFRNSSIHHSFQRCLTVHSTQRALVQNNVCYNFKGHGYFLEEGDEIDNLLVGNLAIYGLRPLADKILLDSDRGGSFDEQRASAMSGFWISHPRNVVRGNVVSGTQGTGFWMSFITGDLPNTNGNIINQNPITLNGERIVPAPNRSVTTDFSENVSHANVVGMNWDAAPSNRSANNPRNPDDKLLEISHYFPPVTPTFNNLVNYKNIYTGIYFRGQTVVFENAMFADNGWSMFFAYNQIVRNSNVIGRSHNHSNRDDEFLYTVEKRFAPNKQHGIVLYDGPFELNNVNFLNFPSEQILKTIDGTTYDITPSVFGDIGGHRRYFNQVSGLYFSPEPYYRMFSGHGEYVKNNNYQSGWFDVHYSSHLRDLDGSLTGTPGSFVVAAGDFNINSQCRNQSFAGKPSFSTYKVCGASQSLTNLYLQGVDNGNKVPFVVMRNDSATGLPLGSSGFDIERSLQAVANVDTWAIQNKFNMIGGFDYSVIFRPQDARTRLFGMPRMLVSLTTEKNSEISPIVRFVNLGQSCRFESASVRRAASVEELRSLNETAYVATDNEFFFRIKSNAPSWQMAAGGRSQQSVGDYYITCDAVPQAKIRGHIDGLFGTTVPAISGWACDQSLAESIDVHLYAGGAAGAGGVFVGSYKANKTSENAVLAACGVYKGAYRFAIELPNEVRQAHGGKKIYIHGISLSGGANLTIGASGSFTIPALATSPTPTSPTPTSPTPTSPTPTSPTPTSPTPTSPTPTSPTPAVTPVITGNIDGVYNNVVVGWACDKGIAQSIPVHVYIGGAAGTSGAFMATSGMADLVGSDSAAVQAACGVATGGYRFNIMIPRGVRETHAGKKIYIHGISTSSTRPNLTIGNSGSFAVPAVAAREVNGYVDQISASRVVHGWACNTTIAQSIKVHFYAGGPAGTGIFVGEALASQNSEDAVRAACGVSNGQYRFSYQLPASASGKRIYVYGLSQSGDNKNLDLNFSGYFTAP